MGSTRWDLSRSEAKVAELSAVLKGAGRERLLILCHNNPDPDAIAGAYGLHFLLKKRFGVRSTMAYGGMVTRAENTAMISRLRIKMTRLTRVEPARYLGVALIDTQPGTGNNLFDARDASPLIVIDHHPSRKSSLKAKFGDVRPDYGATSTIVTEYLVAAGIAPSRSVANALLYGLKTDTRSLARGATKTDLLAFNYLSPLTNPRVISGIENPKLPMDYFEDYMRGLASTRIYRDVAISYVGKIKTDSIIPELADLLLRIDTVYWTLCMGEHKGLLILSVRSTSRKFHAGNVMRRLIGKAGSGGGHREMAGGMIPLTQMEKCQRQELPEKLIHKLLKMLDRSACMARPIAEPTETRARGHNHSPGGVHPL